ncbi:DUF4145 domain-containing protein [Roseibacillus persicicus]|uniref:DUF4145 domain-containing protein n=1 Tax=Roseibacillus persicicus TaxID=454148 RepID=UPI00398AB2CB
MEEMPPEVRERLPCNNCQSKTNHSACFSHSSSFTEWDSTEKDGEFALYSVDYEWSLWICCGCDTPVLRQRSHYNGDYNQDGKPRYSYSYYPDRTEYSFSMRHFGSAPEKIRVIYRESCLAYNSAMPLLCAGGLRALTEAICKSQNTSGDNLYKRIEGLKKTLPTSLVDNLHGLRYLGNKALHEIELPDMHDLRLGLDILSDLMNFLYELDYKASLLTRRTQSAP